jgi:hypothetical protein
MKRLRMDRGNLARSTLLLLLCIGCASEWEDEAKSPPVASPKKSCPKVSLGTLILQPCCTTTDNHCGGDASALGYGCVALENPTFRSSLTNPPEPMTCDGKPLKGAAGEKADAGSKPTDAGTRRDAGR